MATTGRAWGFPAAVLALALAAPGCARKDAPSAAAKAPEGKPATEAPAPKPAPAPEAAPAAEPAWPASIPATWKVLNDYEAPLEGRRTLWGGHVGEWGFRGGKCVLSQVEDGGSKRLQVQFSLPMDNSQCGTYEYLEGDKGKPKPVDISAYGSLIFLAKSGDGQPHSLRLEVTELDPYDAANQGYTGESPALAVSDAWQRYEVVFDQVLHPMFNRKSGKQVGIRIDRKDQGDAGSGVVLLDNITFVAKATP